jgi:hypothetical protein
MFKIKNTRFKMIKFLYVGNQLVDGRKQFCFIYTQPPYKITNIAEFGGPRESNVFESWNEFEQVYNRAKENGRMREDSSWDDGNYYNLGYFKSLMPPELLPEEEKCYETIGLKEEKNNKKPSQRIDDLFVDYTGTDAEAIIKYLDEIIPEIKEEIKNERSDALECINLVGKRINDLEKSEKPKVRPSKKIMDIFNTAEDGSFRFRDQSNIDPMARAIIKFLDIMHGFG